MVFVTIGNAWHRFIPDNLFLNPDAACHDVWHLVDFSIGRAADKQRHKFRTGRDPQFPVDNTNVGVDRVVADKQLCGHFLFGFPGQQPT